MILDNYTVVAPTVAPASIVTADGDGDSVRYCSKIFARAASTNTSTIRVGNRTISYAGNGRGPSLAKNEFVILDNVYDPRGIYCFSDQADQKLEVMLMQ